jgi:DNA-binding GntR family transcriptional regulator
MEKYNPLQNTAYEYLKKNIFLGRLKSGCFYSETKIAKEIGLSRTPMREALQQLQRNKLVEIIPSKGFRIWKMSKKDVMEIYQVRAAIEGYAAIQIAKGRSSAAGEKVIKTLQKIHTKQTVLLKTPFNIDAFTKMDQHFHETMVTYLQNFSLSELFNSLFYRIRAICISTFQSPNRPIEALQEHRAIIDSLCAGKDKLAYDAVLHHVENVERIMIMLLEQETGES